MNALPETPPRLAPAPWQRRLAEAVRSVGELCDLLGLDLEDVPGADPDHRDFPLRVPRGFVARMRPGDPEDPLLLQVLPLEVEGDAAPGFARDPLGEAEVSPVPGLLHKYRGRALVVLTGACGVHCRYCFRRHFPYGEHQLGGAAWRRVLAAIAAEPDLDEVILSGGDPLSLSDEKLAVFAAELAELPRLRRLRVHTRMPVVLPERVDDALLEWLGGSRLKPVVVVHANHPRELGEGFHRAMARLRDAGVTLLNQAVLLRRVNDSVAALRGLSEALFDAGVLPYYLHLMDRVQGAAHFEVGEDEARRLLLGLTAELPGYLVPRLVREVPGAPAKQPVPLVPSLYPAPASR